MRSGNGTILGFATGVFENGGIVVLSQTGYCFVVWRGNGLLRGVGDSTNESVSYDNPGCLGTVQLPFRNGFESSALELGPAPAVA